MGEAFQILKTQQLFKMKVFVFFLLAASTAYAKPGKENIQKVISALDTNENGGIELTEFVDKVMEFSQGGDRTLFEKPLEAIFNCIDQNDDQKIDLEDFKLLNEKERENFKIVDENNDGNVDKEEFQKFIETEVAKLEIDNDNVNMIVMGITGLVFEKLFDLIDADKDGMLQLDEVTYDDSK